jgi:uncharacterized protein YbaR (Trm112 family)/ubiquinone/menaquinone biosynthesis C-methylase UbiE
MNRSALEWLACPACQTSLTLATTESVANEVYEGMLSCVHCGVDYPIVDGIPRFLKRDEASNHQHWDDVWIQTQLEAPIRRIERAFDRPGGETYFAMLGLARQALENSVERCVEIGCGSGSYSLMLRKAGIVHQSILIDFSLQALYLARALFNHFHLDCTLVQADGRHLPVRTGVCDLSISGGVIEHFCGAAQESLVAEHCRVAERVLCQCPLSSAAYWILRLGVTTIKLGWPFGDERPLSRRNVRRLFSAAHHQVVMEAHHDWLTAVFFLLSTRYKWIPPIQHKSYLNRLFQHEVLVYTVRGD